MKDFEICILKYNKPSSATPTLSRNMKYYVMYVILYELYSCFMAILINLQIEVPQLCLYNIVSINPSLLLELKKSFCFQFDIGFSVTQSFVPKSHEEIAGIDSVLLTSPSIAARIGKLFYTQHIGSRRRKIHQCTIIIISFLLNIDIQIKSGLASVY